MNLEEEIVKMVKKLSDEAKNYVSDSHQYRNVNASIRNSFDNICGKAFGLTVEQTPDKFNRHFLTMNLHLLTAIFHVKWVSKPCCT